MRLLPLLCCLAVLGAADLDPAVAAYQKAEDVYAKRKAVKGLGGSAADEATLLPLFQQAINDRATAEIAMDAIRQRFAGSKVAFPSSNVPERWSEWLAIRQKEVEAQRRLDRIENKNKPATPATAPGAQAQPEGETAATAPAAAAPTIPTDELGKIDRIIYKSGASLRAYVRSRRVDADNNLVSVRVVHPDGRGEEVIEAKVIARIEEDVE